MHYNELGRYAQRIASNTRPFVPFEIRCSVPRQPFTEKTLRAKGEASMGSASISALLVTAKHSWMALVAIVVLTACGGSGPNALADTAWELESLTGGAVLPGTTITLEFSDDQISGSAGCNHYGGSYQTSGDSLSTGDLFATEMACLDPKGILEQEQAYLTALRAAARAQVTGDRLEIYDNAGTRVLVFVAVSLDRE
jgi:heat shock protein HslJ